MAKALGLLILFHLLFFRTFYFQNSYTYARGELLEQGYASSRLLGRELRAGRFPPHDPYYYPCYPSLPFLATFYPPHLLQAWLGSFLSLDQAWRLFSFTILCHFLMASVSMYILVTQLGLSPWSAGLVSLVLSYGGYNVKPNASIVYTTAWIPTLILLAMKHATLLFGMSLGMMLLAGYWPLAFPASIIGGIQWLVK